jgi:hypothetical protein
VEALELQAKRGFEFTQSCSDDLKALKADYEELRKIVQALQAATGPRSGLK